MSDPKRYVGEVDDYTAQELRNSRAYSYSDGNFNRDSLFNSISIASPTDNKSKSSKVYSEQEKMNKEKRKLEKENSLLIENIKKLESMSENLRKENLKLRANYEKSEYQKNGFSNMLQKLNEDCKQKAEYIKKQGDHIKKLESQLLMGSLHHSLYEENKKLKDTLKNLEDDNKEKSEKIIELSERLVKSSHELEMYKSAAEINLIEMNENLESTNKVTLKDVIGYIENKNKVEALKNENIHLRNMLSENSKSVDNLTKELERKRLEIEEHQTEVAAYENLKALEASDKEVKALQHNYQELLNKETTLNEKMNYLQEEANHNKILIEKEAKKTKEWFEKYEKTSKENMELKKNFDIIAEQNEQLRNAVMELEKMAKDYDHIDAVEKERDELLKIGEPQKLKEAIDAKEKIIRDKNSQLEQLIEKVKGYEKHIRDLDNKNLKQEEAIAKYQEVIEFSQNFIQKMEQKFYSMLTEDQNSKKLKIEIHRLIESCIKRMLNNSS